MNWCELNVNPKERLTEDCQIRALTTFLEIPYNQVTYLVGRSAGETGYTFNSRGNSIHLLEEMLGAEKHEFKGTVNALTKRLTDKAIIFVKGHAVCGMHNAYFDTWDSGRKKVECYYTLSGENRKHLKASLLFLEQYKIF